MTQSQANQNKDIESQINKIREVNRGAQIFQDPNTVFETQCVLTLRGKTILELCKNENYQRINTLSRWPKTVQNHVKDINPNNYRYASENRKMVI